ncbi:MAG TPA: hypothetical protein DCQ29_07150 [Chitinophagaceae bacterium]|nr:hypothetical protein [Chitinophagaceae bacterium]
MRKFEIYINKERRKEKPKSNEVGKIACSIDSKAFVDVNEFFNMVVQPYSYTWFGGKYEISKGAPSKDNWLCTSVIALDFDKLSKDFSIEKAVNRFRDVGIIPQFWYETFSSNEDVKSYRIVYILDEPIDNRMCLEGCLEELYTYFENCDTSCRNINRFFFGGKSGKLIHTNLISTKLFIEYLSISKISKANKRTRVINRYYNYIEKMVQNEDSAYTNNSTISECAKIDECYSNEPPKYLLKFNINEMRKKIKILDEFLDGKWLHHPQLFGLATNMQYINGGQKLMIETMNNFNKKGVTQYTSANFSIFTYLKKVTYKPMWVKNFSKLKEDSNLKDIISEMSTQRGMVEVKESFFKDELENVETEFKNKFQNIIENGIEGKIYIIKAPVGIGKTQNLINLKNVVVAAPTNNLKDEIGNRMQSKFVITPPKPYFKDIVHNENLNSFYDSGYYKKAKQYLYNLSNRKKGSEDAQVAKLYLHNLDSALKSSDTVITTHKRVLVSSFNHNTLIFDEDPLQSMTSIGKVTINDLKGLKNIGIDIPNSMKTFIDSLNKMPSGVFIPLDFKHELDLISDRLIFVKKEIVQFFTAVGFIKEIEDESTLYFLCLQDMPFNKKIIILSASIPTYIYEQLYKDRVEIIELSDVKQKGEIIQYTNRSYSRCSINYTQQTRTIPKFNMPVITFKSTNHIFNSKPLDIYFGNCAGYDTLKGRDIVVLGTPYHNVYFYLLFAGYFKLDISDDFKMKQQEVEYNGFLFKFNCFSNPLTRIIQLQLIEGDLIQAVGRARTIRTDAKVHLYSNLPLRMSTTIKW